MTIPAPFDRYRGEVVAEWIDLNGHMNLAYYTVLFDFATDLLFETIGIGKEYKQKTNHGTFVAETHNLYERELLVREQVRVVTQILGADDKRIHLAHEMYSLADSRRAATQELMFLSIDLVVAGSFRSPPACATALRPPQLRTPRCRNRTGSAGGSRCRRDEPTSSCPTLPYPLPDRGGGQALGRPVRTPG